MRFLITVLFFISIGFSGFSQMSYLFKTQKVIIYRAATKDEVSKSIHATITSIFIDKDYVYFRIGDKKYPIEKKEIREHETLGSYIYLKSTDSDYHITLEYYLNTRMVYLDYEPISVQYGKFIVYY